MKKCFKCGKRKALTEFYKHPHMADGYLNKCKECAKLDVRRNYRANVEKYKEYDKGRAMLPHRVAARKRYAASPEGKKKIAELKKKWQERNVLKRAAHIIVGNSLRNGTLLKSPCNVCGSTTRIYGHHEDYEKPLDVIWLCDKHHKERHKEMERS